MKKESIKSLLISLVFIFYGAYSYAQIPELVADINMGMNGSTPNEFVEFNNKLYFQADTGSSGAELWVYDGVNAPSMVADINPGFGSSTPEALTVFNGKLYFRADNGTNGRELFEYDGLNAPAMVADIYPGFLYGLPSFTVELVIYKNALYFQGNDSTYGSELWKYDGLNAPTMVADIQTGSSGSAPAYLKVYNDTLYFSADNGVNGGELMKYDGVNPPTVAAEIRAGASGSFPTHLQVFNNRLYFAADDGSNGTELWQYDDVTGMIVLIGNINPSASGSFPENLIVYNNKLYFSANDGSTGSELYSYDGTNPPSLVEDLYTGAFNPSTPENFVVYNDTLYFTATDGTVGHELRKYSGSGSIELVADLFSGIDGSFISQPLVFNDQLYFGGDDETVGYELWTINTNISCDEVHSTDVQFACDSLVWMDGNTYYSNNNSATHTLSATSGCDSIITLDLTIFNKTFGTDVIEACDHYTWINGKTYYSSNFTDTDTLFNVVGCDSIVTLNLTIHPTTQTIDEIEVCDSLVWIDGNTYYSDNDTAIHTLTASTGCDSIVKLSLRIKEKTFYELAEINCSAVTINGQTYDSTGTYEQILVGSNGCDSILRISYVKGYPVDTLDVTSCNYYQLGNSVYSETGMYTYIIPGCDTIVLNLTIQENDTTYLTETVCDHYTIGENVYETSGVYTITLPSQGACDSVVVLDLTVNKSYDSTDVVFACDAYTWINGTTYYETTDTAKMVYARANGCDSTIYLNLTLEKNKEETITIVNCEPQLVNGVLLDSTGFYTQNLQTTSGCDSTLYIDFSLIEEDTVLYATACDRYTLNDVTYTTSDTYTQTTCGYTTTLHLTVNEKTITSEQVVACTSYSWHGTTYTQPGDYQKIYVGQNAMGCDSIAFLELIIDRGNMVDITENIVCDSYTFGDSTYTSSTSLIDTLSNLNGCDSIVHLSLKVGQWAAKAELDLNTYNSNISTYEFDFSNDGKTVAVSMLNIGKLTGEVRVFELLNGAWTPKGEKISWNGYGEGTEYAVELSGDGKVVAYSSYLPDVDKSGDLDGIYGGNKGFVKVFQYGTEGWNQMGPTIDSTNVFCVRAHAIALAQNGMTMALSTLFDNCALLGGPKNVGNITVLTYNANNQIWEWKGLPIKETGDLWMISEFVPGNEVELSNDGNTIGLSGSNAHFIFGREIPVGNRVYNFNGTSWVEDPANLALHADGVRDRELEDEYVDEYHKIDLTGDGQHFASSRYGFVERITCSYGSFYSRYDYQTLGIVQVWTKNGNSWVAKGGAIKGDCNTTLGRDVSITDDGNMLVTQTYSAHVNFYRYVDDQWSLEQQIADQGIYGCEISPDGAYVSYATTDNFIKTLGLCGDTVTSIDEINVQQERGIEFSVYPNPNNGVFTIQLDNMEASRVGKTTFNVYNNLGKVVKSGRLTKSVHTLDLSTQPNGVYFIRLNTTAIHAVRKMVIRN